MKTTIKIRPEFIMSATDIAFLNALPANMPETKLSTKEIARITELYYKYIGKLDTQSWGPNLFDIEKKEKWTGGKRTKTHEGKRFILGWLVDANERKSMTPSKAADYFFTCLTSRPAFRQLISKIWDIKTK